MATGSIPILRAAQIWNCFFCLEQAVFSTNASQRAYRIPAGVVYRRRYAICFQYLHHCRSIHFSKDASYHYTIAPGSAMLSSRDYTQPYEKPSGSCLKRGAFPCQSLTGHYPDGRLTQVLSLLPIRLSSTEAIRNSRSGGVNFVRRRYTVPPLLRKSHPVINEEFCILLCTLRTRLQYMCFSDC